jgi:hypothetical protein
MCKPQKCRSWGLGAFWGGTVLLFARRGNIHHFKAVNKRGICLGTSIDPFHPPDPGVRGLLGLRPSDICLILVVATTLYVPHPDVWMSMKEKRSPETFWMYAPGWNVLLIPDPRLRWSGGTDQPAGGSGIRC